MTLTPEQSYEFILTALCIWREARGESRDGKRAVGWVIRNRATTPSWWGSGWAAVVLKPLQFSSFNADDPNAKKLPAPTDQSWMDCLGITCEVFSGHGFDPTKGATHYYDDSIPKPAWADKMTPTLKVGKLNFYRENI